MDKVEYTIVVSWDEDDACYFAYIPDLQGCMGDGETPQDAVSDVIAASKDWIDTQVARGAEVPYPGEERDHFEATLREQEEHIAALEEKLAAANQEIRALKNRAAVKGSYFARSPRFAEAS